MVRGAVKANCEPLRSKGSSREAQGLHATPAWLGPVDGARALRSFSIGKSRPKDRLVSLRLDGQNRAPVSFHRLLVRGARLP